MPDIEMMTSILARIAALSELILLFSACGCRVAENSKIASAESRKKLQIE